MNLQQTIDEIQKRLSAENFRRLNQAIDRIKAKDGFSVSVQAGPYLRSTPRSYHGPWTAVELGFPSRRLPTLAEYAEEPKRHTKTVFNYVPIEKVAQIFLDHGGLI